MKLTIFPKHFCALAVTSLFIGQAQAATLISDTFAGAAGELNGRAPETAADSLWRWNAPAGNFATNGSGGLTVNVGTNRTGGVILGNNYFGSNPGIYTLSSTISFGSGASTSSWYGIGFSTIATDANFGTENLSHSTSGGYGWMILRTGGDTVIFPKSGTANNVSTNAGTTGVNASSTNTLKLVLNTSGTSWTLNAFINDFELDFNGAAAGTAQVWSGGDIPNLTGVAISTGASGAAGVAPSIADNFELTFTPVPEPASAALLGLASLLPMLRRKR